MIDVSDKLSPTKRAEPREVASTKPCLNRYVRVTPGGLLRVDSAAIKSRRAPEPEVPAPRHRPEMSTEDIALGYKQLIEVKPVTRATAEQRTTIATEAIRS